jgi:hypothetical protein
MIPELNDNLPQPREKERLLHSEGDARSFGLDFYSIPPSLASLSFARLLKRNVLT